MVGGMQTLVTLLAAVSLVGCDSGSSNGSGTGYAPLKGPW
jgi:hypothetical protein